MTNVQKGIFLCNQTLILISIILTKGIKGDEITLYLQNIMPAPMNDILTHIEGILLSRLTVVLEMRKFPYLINVSKEIL